MNYLSIFTIGGYFLSSAMGEVRLFHIIIASISLALLILALAQVVLLHLQNKYLKTRNFPSLITKLPSRESMDNLLFKILKLGLFLLTVTIITSLLPLPNTVYKIHPAKLILSISAWILFSYLIIKRSKYGLSSTKTALYTFIGVLTLCLATFIGEILNWIHKL